MKLNIKKFMMTEMGGELEETIKAWDQALEERRKATPGIGDPDQGIGFGYWDRTCKSCQDRWEVFKLAIRQFYGIEFNFTRTDEYFGICNDDETIWLMKENRSLKRLHVTLWKLQDTEDAHSDDECEIEAASIQVNIWSRSDQQTLVKRIKKLMKENGFLFQEGNDQIETDTGIFINAMRFLILKEAEETEE